LAFDTFGALNLEQHILSIIIKSSWMSGEGKLRGRKVVNSKEIAESWKVIEIFPAEEK
jgi:hypothetical protein